MRDNEKNPEDIAYQVSTLVQVLDKMQQYAGCIPCDSFEDAHEYLTITNAYKDPDEARLIM